MPMANWLIRRSRTSITSWPSARWRPVPGSCRKPQPLTGFGRCLMMACGRSSRQRRITNCFWPLPTGSLLTRNFWRGTGLWRLNRNNMQRLASIGVLLVLATAMPAFAQRSLEAMMAEADQAQGAHQAMLCVQLSDQLVTLADLQFKEGESQQGLMTVQRAFKYAIKAHDATIKSHSRMKETEIHLREIQRHLESVKRIVPADDRPQLDEVEKRIAQLRQDIMHQMFAPKKKENK